MDGWRSARAIALWLPGSPHRKQTRRPVAHVQEFDSLSPEIPRRIIRLQTKPIHPWLSWNSLAASFRFALPTHAPPTRERIIRPYIVKAVRKNETKPQLERWFFTKAGDG
jgi:hypothetical protein